MAKDSSKGANQDNIDTYSDTSIIFPPRLLSKKIKIKNKSSFTINKKEYLEELNKYLHLKDPKYLLKALSYNDGDLWYGRSDYDEFLNNVDYKDEYLWEINKDLQVNSSIIIWETITYWFLISSTKLINKAILSQIEKFLKKIAPTLIYMPTTNREIYLAKDGLLHINTHIKGQSNKVIYNDPDSFLKEVKIVKDAFLKVKSKSKRTKEEKINDAKKAIKLLGKEIPLNDVKLLNLKDVNTSTISYIAIRHEHVCKKCKDIGNSTIANLISSAKSGYRDPFIYYL